MVFNIVFNFIPEFDTSCIDSYDTDNFARATCADQV